MNTLIQEKRDTSTFEHEIRSLLDNGFTCELTGDTETVLGILQAELEATPALLDDVQSEVSDFIAENTASLLYLRLEDTQERPDGIDAYDPNKYVVYRPQGSVRISAADRNVQYTAYGTVTSGTRRTEMDVMQELANGRALLLSLGIYKADDLTALDTNFDLLIDTLASLGISEDVIEEMIALLISGDAPPSLVEAAEAIIALGQAADPAEIPAILQKLEASLAEALPQAKSEKVAAMVGRITDALMPLTKADPANLLLGIQTYKTLMALDVTPDVAREMTALIISGDAPPALMETAHAIVAIGKVGDMAQIPALLERMETSLAASIPQAKSDAIALALGRISAGLQPVIKAPPAAIMPKVQAFQRGEPPRLSERLSALKVIANVVQTTAALIRNPDLPKADKDKLSVTLASLRANISNPASSVFNQAFVKLVTHIMPLAQKFPLPSPVQGLETAKQPSILSLRIANVMQSVTKAAIILMPSTARQTLSLPVGLGDKPSALLDTKYSMGAIQNVAALIAKPAVVVSTGRMAFAAPLASPRTLLQTIKTRETPLAAPVLRRLPETTARVRNDNQKPTVGRNPLRIVTQAVVGAVGSVLARQTPVRVAQVENDMRAPIKGNGQANFIVPQTPPPSSSYTPPPMPPVPEGVGPITAPHDNNPPAPPKLEGVGPDTFTANPVIPAADPPTIDSPVRPEQKIETSVAPSNPEGNKPDTPPSIKEIFLQKVTEGVEALKQLITNDNAQRMDTKEAGSSLLDCCDPNKLRELRDNLQPREIELFKQRGVDLSEPGKITFSDPQTGKIDTFTYDQWSQYTQSHAQSLDKTITLIQRQDADNRRKLLDNLIQSTHGNGCGCGSCAGAFSVASTKQTFVDMKNSFAENLQSLYGIMTGKGAMWGKRANLTQVKTQTTPAPDFF